MSRAVPTELELARREGIPVIALLGNPNVGKSTLFNGATGLRQHTGNWPGKTVEVAMGRAAVGGGEVLLVDLPGTYSLQARSPEEQVTWQFLSTCDPTAVIVVCDAACLSRNCMLLYQVLEITPRVLLCVNLMDEAASRGITPDLALLQERMGIPVVGTVARDGLGLTHLLQQAAGLSPDAPAPAVARYGDALEDAMLQLSREQEGLTRYERRLLLTGELPPPLNLTGAVAELRAQLAERGCSEQALRDQAMASLQAASQALCAGAIERNPSPADRRQQTLDRLLTSKATGIPIMILLLSVVLWLTISGANLPSALLMQALGALGGLLARSLAAMRLPAALISLLCDGVYRVTAWVVAVMLPPMAIFFPLFTLLEEFGLLPRIAFNLDHCFKRCGACGKQALTMCMGMGCNAAGVVGCRIIDSPRERLIAMLTNTFVPCNGRFPTLLLVIGMFFAGSGVFGTLVSAVMLTALLVLGVVMTLLASRLLTRTLLRGTPSSFTLELPPYRKPRLLTVLTRSLLDRTLFVLWRALIVSAPAGLLLWLGSNLGDGMLLQRAAAALQPMGHFLGMDGVLLLAFLLGMPANEIVLPLACMLYLGGDLAALPAMPAFHALLLAMGWTPVTALCVLLFSLLHWPCTTTLLTIRRESRSLKWTAVAALLPTLAGTVCCGFIAACARLLQG